MHYLRNEKRRRRRNVVTMNHRESASSCAEQCRLLRQIEVFLVADSDDNKSNHKKVNNGVDDGGKKRTRGSCKRLQLALMDEDYDNNRRMREREKNRGRKYVQNRACRQRVNISSPPAMPRTFWNVKLCALAAGDHYIFNLMIMVFLLHKST